MLSGGHLHTPLPKHIIHPHPSIPDLCVLHLLSPPRLLSHQPSHLLVPWVHIYSNLAYISVHTKCERIYSLGEFPLPLSFKITLGWGSSAAAVHFQLAPTHHFDLWANQTLLFFLLCQLVIKGPNLLCSPRCELRERHQCINARWHGCLGHLLVWFTVPLALLIPILDVPLLTIDYCWAYSTLCFGGSNRQNPTYIRQAHDEEFWINSKIYKENKVFQHCSGVTQTKQSLLIMDWKRS